MGNVHGDLIIKRRDNVESQDDFHKYLGNLQDDFYHMCGYCGKSELLTKKGFEIDHLVPISKNKFLETEYSNLVYSCFTCNRKKGKKWPMGDNEELHDYNKGLIDPASSEYNENIMRDDEGNIVGKTVLGKYVCEKVFKFHLRPMHIIYKLMLIKDLKKELINKNSSYKNNMLKLREIEQQIDDFEKIIFKYKE